MSDGKATGKQSIITPGTAPSDIDAGTIGKKASGVQDKFGFTFGNYKAPTTSWGEALTPDDLRFTYLMGITLTLSNGQRVVDEQFKFWIDEAVTWFERRLDIVIPKTRFASKPHTTGKVQGVDFDKRVDPYPYRWKFWKRDGFIQLVHKPIIVNEQTGSIERAIFKTIIDTEIINLVEEDWIRLEEEPGQIWIFPKTLGKGTSVFFGAGLSLTPLSSEDYNDAFEFDYTAGFRTPFDVPEDLRGMIGKRAAVEALNAIGDGLLAGFSSSSIGLDGISESFSSTQSATNAQFGARISQYEKEIEKWLEKSNWAFNTIPFVGM